MKKAILASQTKAFGEYWDFLTHALRLDFGTSIVSHQPVMQEIWARFPYTAELALSAGPSDQRNCARLLRSSATNRSGCSNAAKCPPWATTFQ